MYTTTRIIALAITLCLLVILPVIAQTPTMQWVNFYSSNTTIDGQPIPVGAVVEAYDPQGVICGHYVVDKFGSYGFLVCYLDDPNTEQDEGVKPGDRVVFKINGFKGNASFRLPSNLQNGERFERDLSILTIKPPVAVPEPITFALFGLGLIGLVGISYRERHRFPN